jgi:putative nucleotidyltransferase with HDIG domain
VPGRPSKTLIALEFAALATAIAVAVWANRDSDWDLPLLAVLLAAAAAGDVTAVDTPTSRLKISSSFLAIVTAIVFLGESPAAAIAVAAILAGWLRFRYAPSSLLINLVTYAWFPLLSGLAFHACTDAAGIGRTDVLFYVLVFGLFVVALVIDFVLSAGYISYVEGSRFRTKARRALFPLLPAEFISALLAVGVAYLYVQSGLPTVAMFGVVIVVFQYLISALLLSQQRGDELELRAKQLAGFQVALLSALLRTLDLRDRMTARHSAAVARYSREIAKLAGLTPEEQELAHTAGLFHDIGKFVLPDRILKGNEDLTEADWEEIRKHPQEGARIVAEIDGYRPVGEIIVAHHERIDGLGYPRGLRGDDIPVISRIIAVGNTYDVLTARDSYRTTVSPDEALAELRRSAGTQLEPRFVEILAQLLFKRDPSDRRGETADFETELALDRRIHDYVTAGMTAGPRISSGPS